MSNKKPKATAKMARSASRTTRSNSKPKFREPEYQKLREKLQLAEQQRDAYEKELRRLVVRYHPASQITDEELDEIRRTKSNVSIDSIIRELEKDAKRR